MITLTMYLYFFFTGKVEWDKNLAMGLAVFDLLVVMELTELTLIEIGRSDE